MQCQEGEWLSLLRDSAGCSEMAHTSAVRRRCRGQAEDAGELSSARQALEVAPFVSGNLATLGILTDPSRRPPIPRRA